MIDITSRWEDLSFTPVATAIENNLYSNVKGDVGSSPWLESGNELELHLYGEMEASWDLEARALTSPEREAGVGVGERRGTPGC